MRGLLSFIIEAILGDYDPPQGTACPYCGEISAGAAGHEACEAFVGNAARK